MDRRHVDSLSLRVRYWCDDWDCCEQCAASDSRELGGSGVEGMRSRRRPQLADSLRTIGLPRAIRDVPRDARAYTALPPLTTRASSIEP